MTAEPPQMRYQDQVTASITVDTAGNVSLNIAAVRVTPGPDGNPAVQALSAAEAAGMLGVVVQQLLIAGAPKEEPKSRILVPARRSS